MSGIFHSLMSHPVSTIRIWITANLSVLRELDLALDLHLLLLVPRSALVPPPPQLPVPPGAVGAHPQEPERLVASVDSILLSSAELDGK